MLGRGEPTPGDAEVGVPRSPIVCQSGIGPQSCLEGLPSLRIDFQGCRMNGRTEAKSAPNRLAKSESTAVRDGRFIRDKDERLCCWRTYACHGRFSFEGLTTTRGDRWAIQIGFAAARSSRSTLFRESLRWRSFARCFPPPSSPNVKLFLT